MKSPSFFAITLSVATLSAFCGTPPSSQTQTAAYENSVEQARLREKAARLKIEMLQLLNDFRQYPGTASDISQAEAAAENLGALSEKDMLSVIETLRDASRTNAADTDSRLVKASNGQKAIQSALRSVADRLALQKDSAAMQLRVRNLFLRQLANRRQAENLLSGSSQRSAAPVMTAEQEALHEEIGQLLRALKKLAASPQLTARQMFAAALIAGENAQISARSDATIVAARQLDLPTTIAGGGQVMDALQAMITALNSTTSKEVQAQGLAARMKELADSQTQLAANTVSSNSKNQNALQASQQRISDETEAAAREAAQLDPKVAAELTKAMQAMQNAGSALKTDRSLEKADNRVSIAQAQTDASENLTKAATLLDEQSGTSASANAGNSPSDDANNAASTSPAQSQDPAAAAVAQAASDVMAAQQQMQAASQFLRSRQAASRAGQANQQMQAAQNSLAQAAASAAQSGTGLPESVGENLKKAGQQLEKSQFLAASDPRKAQNSLNAAAAQAGNALKALQQAANRLAAEASNPSEQSSATGGSKSATGGFSQNDSNVESSTSSELQSASGGGGNGTMSNGSLGYGRDANMNVSVSTHLSPQDRAALSMLQREPAPDAYRDRVQQYFKNLANGETPGSTVQ